VHLIQVYREKRALGYPEAAKLIRRAAKTALHAQGVCQDAEINVMLTDDAGIRSINLEQRGIDAVTDVLSFPMNELAEGDFSPEECDINPETGRLLLGDMVLDLFRCAEQGSEYGHGFDHELQYLTVHSVLHLLGYDHLDDGPRKRAMREREKLIMQMLEPDTGSEEME